MGMILDTSVWIEVECGRLSPGDVEALTLGEPVYLAPPVLAELEYGVQRATTPAHRQRRATALARIRSKPCLAVDAETGITFGRLAAELDASGRPSKHRVHDLWIAALAIQHRLRVLTLNVKDFDGIPGLRVVSARLPHAD